MEFIVEDHLVDLRFQIHLQVQRSLDWIRLAARFPIRIKVDNPDDSFRIGASAVATVSGTWRPVDR